jgi:1-phosphofructokinase
MTVVTVTLNPAIDQTVKVNHFQPNTVNRGQDMVFQAGGKGVNVASFLADYGVDVTAVGFLGEENPHRFMRLFDAKGIRNDFILLPGRTRTGVKIVDPVMEQTTDINMPGLIPDPAAVARLLDSIAALTADHDWFVLPGSIPPGTPPDIYATIITRLKASGKKTVLDTSGTALHAGIEAGPTVVKPNAAELEQYVGHPIGSLEETAAIARRLLGHGIEVVIVSMGEQGALFMTRTEALLAVPPPVTVVSTVGAGDAMVAGFVAGQIQGMGLADCARLATAFSVGVIAHIGTHLPSASALESAFDQVVVQPLPA